MHVPVMLGECLEYLDVRPEGVYLDATAGLGGHTAAIAERLTTGFAIANDRDADSLALARGNTEGLAGRIRYHRGAFSELRTALAGEAIQKKGGPLGPVAGTPVLLSEAATA